MKYGIEVEGVNKGLPTVFVSAEELNNPGGVDKLVALWPAGVAHLYISDHQGVVNLSCLDLSNLNLSLITVETKILNFDYQLPNVSVMFSVDNFEVLTFDLLRRLPSNAQIKLEFGTQHVVATPIDRLFFTIPSDFANDITL